MSSQDDRRSTLHFRLVPFLIGTGVSVILGVGTLMLFNPFENESTQTDSTTEVRESDIPRLVKPADDTASNKSNTGSGESPNLASIFELPTYFESSVALDSVLRNADLSTLVDLIDESHDLQGVERRQSTQTQIFRKFATLDPIRALSHAQSFPRVQYDSFASQIYRDWSEIDLDAALTYAEQHVPTLSWEGKRAVLEQIFRTAWDLSDDAKLQIAAQLNVNPYVADYVLQEIEKDKPLENPTEAWKEVLSVDNFWEDEQDQLVQIALAVIEKDGYAKFADLANAIPKRRVRTRLISLVLSDQMETDEISTVFEQAVLLFHETARPVLFECAERWSYMDPLLALDAMSTVPSDQLRKRLEELVIETWLSVEPLEVVRQLELLPIEYREDALTQGIWSMSGRHPKEATEYLDKVPDPQTRWNIMWSLLQSWAYQDIEEAFTWFLDNPEIEIPLGNSRATFLSSLLSRVTPEIAPSLIEIALKYPVDESGSGWEGNIVGALTYRDFKEAKELLPQVREGPGRLHVYVMIGQAIFRQDQSIDSVIEFTEEIPEEDHIEFYGKFLPRLSPQVAYEHVDDLPTPRAQARAALELLQRAARSSNPPYTNEQIEHLESFLTDKERKVLEQDSPSPQQ
ncbi:MAG: hypothetical protein F4W92_07370 [Gammaproteobacteria bacterium]|nr:hypothetical protein [Gammaproteobacteria bacterium]